VIHIWRCSNLVVTLALKFKFVVYHERNLDLSIHVCTCVHVHRRTVLWLYRCILLATFNVYIMYIIFIILNCFYLHLVSHMGSRSIWYALIVEASWNVMAHAQKPYFVFRRNGRVHLNLRGRQFNRLLAAEVCASAVVILDTPCSEVVWSGTGYPHHSPVSPSLPHTCVTVCHHISTGVYLTSVNAGLKLV